MHILTLFPSEHVALYFPLLVGPSVFSGDEACVAGMALFLFFYFFSYLARFYFLLLFDSLMVCRCVSLTSELCLLAMTFSSYFGAFGNGVARKKRRIKKKPVVPVLMSK